MRFAAILTILLLVSGLVGQGLDEVRLSADFTDRPLREAITHLEKKLGLNFSFPSAVIEASTVNCRFEDANWAEIEQCLFGANQLRATPLRDGYISLKPLSFGTQRQWMLRFRVLDEAGAALPFAPAQFPSAAELTDENGFWGGVITAAATDMVYFSYLGYERKEVPLRNLIAGGAGQVVLQPTFIDLNSVLVSEYLSDGISIPADGSFVRINPKRAPQVPGFASGEVYRTLSLLPGVTNAGETAGRLSIRGGSPDQNLVLWDGIPVYSSGHFFAMVSPFSPDLIEDVNIWRGGAGAAFGGRVGGVVELNTPPSVAERLSGGASLSLLTAEAFLKAPVVKGKSDVQLAFRTLPNVFSQGPAYDEYRTQVFQADAFARILQAEERGLPLEEDFGFKELNGRWRYNFSPERTLTVSSFLQYDDFNIGVGQRRGDRSFAGELITKNDGISGEYAQPLGKGGVRVQLAQSAFSVEGESSLQNGEASIFTRRNSGIKERSVRVEYTPASFAGGDLEAGVQAQGFRHKLDYLTENLLADSLEAFSFQEGRANALAAYGSYSWDKAGPLTMKAGLRLQYYGPTGKLYPEPRLSLGYELGKDWLLKAAYGEGHQFTQEIISLDPQRISSLTPLWALANEGRLPVAASREGSLGLSKEAGNWFFDVEAYHKAISGITTLNSLLVEEGVARGHSRATGLDLLVKRRWANWRSWVVYTISRTEWRFPELGPNYFPADNDRRHQLQLVHTYANKGWSASVGWRLHSGARYTESEAVVTRVWPGSNRMVAELVTGPTNGARLPAFHRLDVSVFRDFAPKSKRWHARVDLSVLNLYGRENVLERRYLISETELLGPNRFVLEELDRFGLGLTPNLSLRVGWE